HSVLNVNSELICATCHECIFDAIHDLYVSDYLNDVNAHVKSKSVKSRSAKSKKKKIWKPTCKVYTNVRYSWKPTGRIFTIDGNIFPLTRIISTKVVPLRKSISTTLVKQTQPSSNKSRKLKDITNVGSSNKSKAIHFKISNHSEPMKNWGSNVFTALSSSRFNFRLRNDQIAKIIGYGDYQLGNLTISRVYNVEGLGHNLFSVGQFCVLDHEVAFRKHTCYVQNFDGADLLFGSRDTNLHNISLDDMLMPMRVKSINGKKYILVIIDDYSRFMWVKLLRSNNEAPEKPDLSFLHVFGSLCYPTNDNEDLVKLKPKADIIIFVVYAPPKKAFRIYHKTTRQIMQTIHVMFDELTAMASEQFSSELAPQLITPGTLSLGLVPNPIPQLPNVPPIKNDWDIFFQPMFDEFFNPLSSVISLV
ncbi:retrovirus-related pol polyprotein from transposon TNT 1-94, partial [Tanacetum coccineum]